MNKEIHYQVHDSPERSLVRVSEKASYLNCNPIREFFANRLSAGQLNFVVDFEECKSLDSTFLGILVRLAIKVRPEGSLSLINLRDRNLETVKNLGIHKIANVSSHCVKSFEELTSIKMETEDDEASTQMIYEAHKALMDLNEKNQKLFCDVIKFLEQKRDESR